MIRMSGRASFAGLVGESSTMKRDVDLCRQILVEVGKWPTTRAPKMVEIEGHSAGEVGYNAWLLAGERLIEGEDHSGDGDEVHYYLPCCLTYKGHDFLEHARNDARWTKAKEKLMSVGGTMTIQMLQVVLKQLVAGEMASLLSSTGGTG